jgi:hypothetical protein
VIYQCSQIILAETLIHLIEGRIVSRAELFSLYHLFNGFFDLKGKPCVFFFVKFRDFECMIIKSMRNFFVLPRNMNRMDLSTLVNDDT